jgi:hypothetical protein
MNYRGILGSSFKTKKMTTLVNNKINRESLTLPEKKIKANKIINLVNNYFNTECKEEHRRKSTIIPRQMAMYYIRTYLDLTANETGKFFPSKRAKSGHKDHATVLHAQRTIGDLIEFDFEIKDFHKDLNDHCKNISELSNEDLLTYDFIEDISNKLRTLDVKQIKRISKYIDQRYINVEKSLCSN